MTQAHIPKFNMELLRMLLEMEEARTLLKSHEKPKMESPPPPQNQIKTQLQFLPLPENVTLKQSVREFPLWLSGNEPN